MLSSIKKNLVFDFDYTLAVIPSSDNQRNKILSKYCHISQEQLLKTMWEINSDYALVSKILKNTQEIEKAYNEILDLNLYLANYVYVLPSLCDAIKKLSLHFNLFVFSGRDTRSLTFAMQKTGLSKYFKDIKGSDKGDLHKPYPQTANAMISRHNMILEKTLYVGDKKVDRDLAANIGCGFIQAKWYRWLSVENVIECDKPEQLQFLIDKCLDYL